MKARVKRGGESGRKGEVVGIAHCRRCLAWRLSLRDVSYASESVGNAALACYAEPGK